eukprot:TRINITY_DN5458_c0_g1_i1.p1 TRINITY_DN5458_c0_g1~~TRINITY_DN5458_c0_g1_i1.p1  ORF type:complete len:201 (-),score=38.79 TRINITY_DN5458_c0_g1_i1:670-1272(-)
MGKGGGSRGGSPGMFSKKGLGPQPAAKPAASHAPQQSPRMPAAVQPKPAAHTPAPAPRPVAAAAPTTGNKPTTAPVPAQGHAPNSPAAMAPASSGGGSLLGTIAANAVSTAGGIVMGHAIMNAFSGGKDSSPEAAEPMAPVANSTMSREDPTLGPCASQYTTFLKCLENSNQNVSQCQWAYDMFSQCKNPNVPAQNQTYY